MTGIVSSKPPIHALDTTKIENIVRNRPDYVAKAVIKWFESIPKDERDRPIIGDFCAGGIDQTFTPRQLYDEIMRALRIELSLRQRAKSVSEMTDTPKKLLTEIIAQYGDSNH